MEIITLSEVEISYYGGGDDKSKHKIQLVFTSESLQLRVMCCDLPEMKCKKKKEKEKETKERKKSSSSFSPLQPAGGKTWRHVLFQEVLRIHEVCREMAEGVLFLVSSNQGLPPATPERLVVSRMS